MRSTHNNLSHANSLRAFTLIELLVVVGIIVVLIGILVPSLSNARRAARMTVCSSNLRQLGVATRLYADTNDGYLPRRGQGVNPTQQIDRPTDWFNALPVAIGQTSYYDLSLSNKVPRPSDHNVLVCPEAVDNGQLNFWSYAMNMWLSVWNSGPLDAPDRINGVGDTFNMVLLADGPNNYCSISPCTPNLNYSPIARHRKLVNICFLDGHVDAMLGSYVGCNVGFIEHTDIRWRVPGSTWSSAQH